MKITLSQSEQKLLRTYLNSGAIEEIEFEESKFYIHELAELISELISDISKSYRVGYKFYEKDRKLLFLNDFQSMDNDFLLREGDYYEDR